MNGEAVSVEAVSDIGEFSFVEPLMASTPAITGFDGMGNFVRVCGGVVELVGVGVKDFVGVVDFLGVLDLVEMKDFVGVIDFVGVMDFAGVLDGDEIISDKRKELRERLESFSRSRIPP